MSIKNTGIGGNGFTCPVVVIGAMSRVFAERPEEGRHSERTPLPGAETRGTD